MRSIFETASDVGPFQGHAHPGKDPSGHRDGAGVRQTALRRATMMAIVRFDRWQSRPAEMPQTPGIDLSGNDKVTR